MTGSRWIIRMNQCGHWYACRLANTKVLRLEYAHPDKLRPNIANEQNIPTGLFKTKEDAAQAAWDLDLELKEMTKFKETTVAKNFEAWAPIGTKVQIKNGKFAGHIGIILHQTTIHRVNMMIFLPDLNIDILCSRSEISYASSK